MIVSLIFQNVFGLMVNESFGLRGTKNLTLAISVRVKPGTFTLANLDGNKDGVFHVYAEVLQDMNDRFNNC
jgi:hypothetical protein